MGSVRGLFDRLERFYDTVPRDGARVAELGSFVLFVRSGTHASYARPRTGSAAPNAADLATMRAQQRELGLPEVFEWVHESTPDLLPHAEAGGLVVLRAPLLVLDPAAVPPGAGDRARLLDPDRPRFAADVAVRRAIAQVGFGSPGMLVGPAGAVERDAATVALAADDLAGERRWHRSGRVASALAPARGPALSSGLFQRVDDVAEIAGVATVPAARRIGLAGAVTAALAIRARDTGAGLVFLTAGSDEVARVYERVGFRRAGTACIAEPPPASAAVPPTYSTGAGDGQHGPSLAFPPVGGLA